MKKVYLLAMVAVITTCLLSCNDSGRGNNGGKESSENIDVPLPAPINPVINVYIENSGSMDGYVNGNTEFKGAIRDMLVLLRHHFGQNNSIRVHFINSRIRVVTDTQTDLANFAANLRPRSTPWVVQGDNQSSSELNNVFRMILDKTDKETISILFSDCIYSISGQDAEGLLSNQKSLTKDAFLSRWRQDSLKLATTIVKMKSKFTGTYYDKNNKKTELRDVGRPYYICIIGNNDVMIDFNAKIPLEEGKIEGFDNKYIISTGATENIYYSVLPITEKVGRFKSDRDYSTGDYVRGIKEVNMRNRGDRLTFAVAVDFRNVAAENDYCMNPDNYTLGDNNFRIKEIKPVGEYNIHPTDKNIIKNANPTHLIILEATGTAISNVKVSLKKQMPQWIAETNIIDDSNIRSNLDKTFGIKYLIEGIAESYQVLYPMDKNFFEFEIKIKE